MRSFLAIELPAEVQQEIQRMGLLLQESGLLEAKYVEEGNAHLTLKFFGEILEKEAAMIVDVLKQVQVPAFPCKIGKLGMFGGRILWADIEDNSSIKKLHDLIDQKLGAFFGEDRRFHNHVTIARIKRIQDMKKLRIFLEKLQIKPLVFSVSEYVLKKSELTPQGPSYEDIYRFSLAPLS